MATWTTTKDGTATGPTITIATEDGEVGMTALWSDDDGVVVNLDADAALPRELAHLVNAAMRCLANLPGPGEPATEMF